MYKIMPKNSVAKIGMTAALCPFCGLKVTNNGSVQVRTEIFLLLMLNASWGVSLGLYLIMSWTIGLTDYIGPSAFVQ